MRLRWTKPAREDLVAIKAYIARDSVVNARRFIARIKESAAQLQSFPE